MSSTSTASTPSMGTVGASGWEAASPERMTERQSADPEKQEHAQERHHPKDKVPHWRLVSSQSLITDTVKNHSYKGSGTEEDPCLVEFIPHDPRNPMQFSDMKKWFIIITVAYMTLAVAFVSAAFSGGTRQIIEDFGISQEVATLGISLFVLGFAVGPLFWALLSELYGRQIVFFCSYAMLTVFNAGAAGANSAATLLILRFLAGTLGSSPLTNAGGVISDLMPANKRVSPCLYSQPLPSWARCWVPLWEGSLVRHVFTVPETYAPVILNRRAEKLRKMTGKRYISIFELKQGRTTPKQAFKKSLLRPLAFLFLEPIVLMISIYMAIIYGTLYMMFAAFPIVFEQERGWSQGIGGLAFMGVAVGMFIGAAYSIWDNKRYVKAEVEHDGEAPPETRLPLGMVGAVPLPIGLFWFAWTNYPSIHWIVCIIATAPFGFGMVLVFLGCMNYLIDSYTIYSASVLAAKSVIRSLFGAAFPLFTTAMYNNLGIHWASSIPAFLALACVPFPFIFYKIGEKIRLKCKYAAQAHQFMQEIRTLQRKTKALERGAAEEEEEEKRETLSGEAEGTLRTETQRSHAEVNNSRSQPNTSRAGSIAGRAESRAKEEVFGRAYSHSSHHNY